MRKRIAELEAEIEQQSHSAQFKRVEMQQKQIIKLEGDIKDLRDALEFPLIKEERSEYDDLPKVT